MKSKLILVLVTALFFISSPLVAAEIKSATMDKYRQIKTDLTQIRQSKVGTFAKDILERAARSLDKAAEGIDAKNEKKATQSLEITVLLIDLAKAKTEEMEAAQKTAVTRAKVEKLSQHLDNILSGKGDEK